MGDDRLRRAHEGELEYWRTTTTEGPRSDALETLLHKASEARVFLECLERYRPYFEGARRILELGGGEGWASCIVRRKVPAVGTLLASDISPLAVASLPKWEHVFRVRVDHGFPCLSHQIPLRTGSVDLVFAFQAAHHFLAHRRTLAEVRRVLRPGGTCLYLHEPACRSFAYPLYRWRAERSGADGPEDVIVFPKLLELAREEGFQARCDFDLTVTHRAPLAGLYYLVQRRVPLLRHVLPGTRHFVFTAPE